MRLFRIACVLVLLFTCSLLARQGGRITGSVTDSETGKPLDGASIFLTGTHYATSSSPEGTFTLSDVVPGTYTLQASLVGYLRVSRDVNAREGEELRIDLRLTASAIITEAMTVTATRARERETPVTFATLGERDLDQRYTVQDVPTLLSELPSTTYYSENGNGIGYTYMSLRGFDQRRLSIMINGIPQNDPEDHNVYWLDFPDLMASTRDVQVQRGAGSAFYGPPAIGGSVNIVTSPHSDRQSLTLFAGMGSYNTRKYSASFATGLINNMYSLYGKYSKILSSGYRNKSWTNFESYYFSAARYDESVTTQINLYGGPIADGLAYYGIPRSDIGDREKRLYNPILRPEEIENFSQPHYELLNEWRISPEMTLNNSVFYVEGNGFFDYDASWADTTYFRLTNPYGFSPTANPANALIRAWVGNAQIGWLPRFTWKHPSGTLIAGAELRRHRSDHWGRIQWAQDLPEGLDPDFHYYEYRGAKDIASFYADEMYKLTPTISVMANFQYVVNRYRLYDEKFIGTDFSVPYRFFNPRLGINCNVSDETNFYVGISRTSREPRLTDLYEASESSGGAVPQFETAPGGSYDYSRPFVKPETLTDVEFGAGYTKGKYTAGVNLFWMDFKNEIVKSGGIDRFGQPRTGNAKQTRHRGIELSGSAEILSGLTIEGNLSRSWNRLVRYTVFVPGGVESTTGEAVYFPKSLDGNRIAGFPDFLANVRMSYHTGGLMASIVLQHCGNQYTNNFQLADFEVDPFTVVNFSASYRIRNLIEHETVDVKFQLNNLLDRLYAAYGIDDQFFPAAGRNFFFGVTIEI